ncbi:fimbrial protein [Achromobacter sp. Bel]|uniref:fimbrial protein n=1 Tax=Achromobacter sp. Bel TaxID=2727415 RepID=UPI00145CC9EF|nr:fimbrial protein [Achromobacter sp. Bel]NMK48351.1 fimbrial protein [Achromobacter sp. Bel]
MPDTTASPRIPHPGDIGSPLRTCLTAILLMAPASLSLAQTAIANNHVRVEISGTIRAKIPCIINNNKPIDIPFGDVQISRIDGKQYKITQIRYTLDCRRAQSYPLNMKISGEGASFNPKLLGIPSQSSLGIALRRDTTLLALNDWFSLTAASPPKLEAVLVAHSEGTITGGEFSASATMVVDYQ